MPRKSMPWLLMVCICLQGAAVCGKFPDWLINDINIATTLSKSDDGNIVLSNGMISRTFSTKPDFTTIDYYNHEKQASILRALSPEAVIGLDGTVYAIGNITTGISRAYLNRTALKEDFRSAENSFHFVDYKTSHPVAPFPYKPMRGAPKDIVWPPKGLRLDVYFKAPGSAPTLHKDVTVCIHYEMYDGIPGMSKWISITPGSLSVNKVKTTVYSVEFLSVNQQWTQASQWDGPYNSYKWMFVGTDQAHGTTVHWTTDKAVRLTPGAFEPVVNVSYSSPVPSLLLDKAGFVSFRVHELPHGASDETRRALSRHRMFRLLAPHTQENPIYFQITKSDSKTFRAAVDQLHEVGFEMIVYSGGSIQIENNNETYLAMIKKDIDYAKSKGIEVGGYDLIVLDRPHINPKYLAVDKHNKTIGNACMASAWYDYISDKILTFIDKTGLSMIDTDGPYGGGTCSSKSHPHHQDYDDSVYQQTKFQSKLYMNLRAKNVYIHQPDNFFYQGGSKTGLGYNENQFSLPRWQDLSVSRQSVFDRIYKFIPTAGWMCLPLLIYHGGGEAAQFEPLQKHLTGYKFGLSQYLGAGVAATYRGNRVFDTDETKQLVQKWVSFYKKYRDILISDMVRVRRPDMQSIDSYIHVNYKLEHKALAMAYNPTLQRQRMNLTLPLYYTGIKKVAEISEQENGFHPYPLDMGWEVEVSVDLPPLDVTWFLVRDGESSHP